MEKYSDEMVDKIVDLGIKIAEEKPALKIGDTEAHNTYCSCRGMKSLTIWANLIKQEIVDNKQVWEGHTRYVNDYKGLPSTTFYDMNCLEYCEKCGLELDDEDTKIGVGGMPD